MKKFFEKGGVSADPDSVVNVLSMEEEAILLGDITNDEGEIQSATDALARNEATVNAVEDVLIIGESNPDPSETDMLLAGAVADMAAAGSDVDGSEILPDVSMSTEGIAEIKNTLKKLWDGMVAMLQRLWAHVKAMFNNYSLLFSVYQKRLDTLKGDVKALKTSNKKIKPDADGTANRVFLYANSSAGAVKSADGVVANLANVRAVVDIAVGVGAQGNLELGRKISMLFSSAAIIAEANAADDMKKKVADFVQSATLTAKKHMTQTSATPTMSAQTNIYNVGKPLPGGKQLIVSIPMTDANNASDAVMLTNLMRSRSEMIEDPKFGKNDNRHANIPVPTVDVLEKMVDEAEKILAIANHYLKDIAGKIETERSTMQKEATRLVTAASKLKAGPITSQVSLILRLNQYYGTAVNSVTNPVMALVRQQVDSVARFVRQCEKAYV